jgi:hypothetical protein
MDEWKAQIDAWEADQRRHAAALAEQATPGVLPDPGQPRRTGPARRWGQEHSLAAHQRRFRCHICHHPSDGPRTFSTVRLGWIAARAYDAEPHHGVAYEEHVDWECPTGLTRCARCDAWSCAAHLYKGICPRCAGKLRPLQDGPAPR